MFCQVLYRTGRSAAAALLLALLAAGCSGGYADQGAGPSDATSGSGTSASPSDSPGASPGGSSSDSASASPSTTPAVEWPAPRRAACYRLTLRQLTRLSDASRPVPCAGRHTARTILVGRLAIDGAGLAPAVDSAAVQRELSTQCRRRLATYVGGSQKTRDLTRFDVVWFAPTQEQSDRGSSWFRCDLVAFSRDEGLLDLPRTAGGSLARVLDRPGALDTFGLCGTAAPGASGFSRVVCARPHAWRAFDTIELPGGRTYPGSGAVRQAGDNLCKDAARAQADDTLKYTYGWEWPTRAQWLAGQHYGFCWVPSTS